MMNFFETDKLTALQAKEKAQWIAFAPVVFQATRALRDLGILKFIEEKVDGTTEAEVAKELSISFYGVRVLMEAGLGMGLLVRKENIYRTTKVATFILHDRLTQVNMDFTHDVCYEGMFTLDESIRTGKPEGLKVFGSWNTIYEALSQLAPPVQKSWFAFDHFYSDVAFPDIVADVFNTKPKRLLDIGGNTGKWAIQCCDFNADVQVTIMDLPGQVNMAREQIKKKGFDNRVDFFETNILDETKPFPKGFDAIWMSQFLDCFSDDQIKSILKRCREALTENGKIYILEPFWDRQRFEVSAFALQQTSLYFTAMANGNSQMYHSGNFIQFIEAAGLKVTRQKDMVGVSHTLLVCESR